MLYDHLTNKALKLRNNRIRIRGIFKALRNAKKFQDLSDISILTFIIELFKNLNIPYSKDEVYSTFKLVNKSEYSKNDKYEIYRYLLEKADNKSVFNK